MAKHTSIDGINALEDKLRRMASTKSDIQGVKAGIVDSAKYPSKTLDGRPDRKNPPMVAQVAFWNEFGTKGRMRKDGKMAGSIPERPFMRNSVDKFMHDMAVKGIIRKFNPANPNNLELIAGRLGNKLKDTIVETIKDGDFEPNAPYTVMIKTKGKGGVTTPLNDTGLLGRSIDYEIIKASDIEGIGSHATGSR